MIVKLLLFIIIFSVIVIVHEGGHCVIGKMSGIGVKEFSIGLGPTIVGFRKGETLYSLKLLPFGGITIFEGDEPDEADSPKSFRKASVGARFATVLAGPLMNFVLAFLLSLIVIGSVGYDLPVLHSVMEGYPAEEAGLQAGDKIVSINNKKIVIYRDITLWTMFNEGKRADVVFERDGELYRASVTPKFSTEDQRFLFGFRGPDAYTKGNPLQVIRYSATEVRYWVEVTIKSLAMLFRGQFTVNDLSGPVGVAEVVGDVYDSSKDSGAYYVWLNMLSLVILLTADLGVMNLLPFPALDGGKLVFIIFEAVTRRKPNEKVEGIINLIGMSFLMILMIYVMFHDISRLIH
ncbi:MAG: RIP metalloprotease RseP [Lachnospiraceae bacterium]|nr:RIP metalloprotease RseP [Lachnospiraceae bacterium]